MGQNGVTLAQATRIGKGLGSADQGFHGISRWTGSAPMDIHGKGLGSADGTRLGKGLGSADGIFHGKGLGSADGKGYRKGWVGGERNFHGNSMAAFRLAAPPGGSAVRMADDPLRGIPFRTMEHFRLVEFHSAMRNSVLNATVERVTFLP